MPFSRLCAVPGKLQRLKPQSISGAIGTSEDVPFPNEDAPSLRMRCGEFQNPLPTECGKDRASTSTAAQPYPKTFVIPNRFSGEESAGPCEQQVPRCFASLNASE